MTSIRNAKRLAAIERRISRAVLVVPVTLGYSAKHQCELIQLGSFVFPEPTTADRWERAAIAQQSRLLATGIPEEGREVVARRERPTQNRPVAGARVRVVRRSDGAVSDHPALDARELLASGEYEVFGV